jgi:O-succinylbenzoate synthase
MPALAVEIDDASVHLVSVPLRDAHRFAGGELTERTLVLVRLGASGSEGWGEAAPVPGYSPDSADEAFTALGDALEHLGSVPGTDALAAGPPAARHALETAVWDLRGRISGTSLAALAGGEPRHVPATAVLGLGAGPEGTAAAAGDLLAAGYARVKVKLAGLGDLAALGEIAGTLPPGTLAADANGSLPVEMAHVVADRLGPIGLSYLEQPFPPGNLAPSAIVADAVPVCLDEEITSAQAAHRALGAGAASLVSIKPARVGGIGSALEVLEAALAAGAGALVGGLLESGIGRAALRALATVPGFGEPGEVGPSLAYLAHDLVTVPASVERTRGVAVPDSPGWGGAVDADAVARCTMRRVDWG